MMLPQHIPVTGDGQIVIRPSFGVPNKGAALYFSFVPLVSAP